MSTTTARQILAGWSHRLRMNDRGITKWTPALRSSVEKLVANVSNMDPDETIELDADVNRDPIAIFVRSRTGEVLGEIPNEHRGKDAYEFAMGLS